MSERERVVVLDAQIPTTPPPTLEQEAVRAAAVLSADQILGWLKSDRTLFIMPLVGEWITQLQRNCVVWLPRQQAMAIVVRPWEQLTLTTLGTIELVFDCTLPSERRETWVCDAKGNGFDGQPVLQAATWLSNIVRQKIVEIERTEREAQLMDAFREAFEAEQSQEQTPPQAAAST